MPQDRLCEPRSRVFRRDGALGCRSWPGGTVRPPTADPPLTAHLPDGTPGHALLASRFAITLGGGPGALYGLRANSAPWPLSPHVRTEECQRTIPADPAVRSPAALHLTFGRPEWSLGTIPAEKSPESRPDPSSRTIPARPTALRATNSCGVCAPDGPEFRAAPMPSIPKCLVTPAASHGGTGTRCREARGVAVQAHASVRTRPD